MAKKNLAWNVAYDGPKGTQLYLSENTTAEMAAKYCAIAREKYEGKSYPNGKGHYPFKNFRVIVNK